MNAIISRMRKLQVRLDRTEMDDILASLSAAVHLGEAGAQLDRYVKLRSWLAWRRVKFWGEFGAEQATAQPGPLALAELDRWLAERPRP